MRSLSEVRRNLLHLHKTLIDAERRDYERVNGRVSDGQFLNALAGDPALAWLKPMTTLLASLDELIDDKAFQRRYAEILQRSPEAVLAHGRVAGAFAGEQA